MKKEKAREIVRGAYLRYLNREPDKKGWESYTNALVRGRMDKEGLAKDLRSSKEYKHKHKGKPIKDGEKLPIKKNILYILNRSRKRSPLLDEFLNYLCGKEVGGVRFERAPEAPKKWNCIPEYVYLGFDIPFLPDWLRNSKAKFIVETGDPYRFGEQRFLQRAKKLNVFAFVCHTTLGLDNVRKIARKNVIFAPVISVPWSMKSISDVKNMSDRKYTWSCLMTGNKPRKKYYFENLKTCRNDEHMIGTNYSDYYDILSDTKYLIVTSPVGAMNQRYVEGAMYGCLLVGDIPDEHNDIFNEKTMVKANPDNIKEKLRECKMGRHNLKAKSLREKVEEKFCLQEAFELFKEQFENALSLYDKKVDILLLCYNLCLKLYK